MTTSDTDGVSTVKNQRYVKGDGDDPNVGKPNKVTLSDQDVMPVMFNATPNGLGEDGHPNVKINIRILPPRMTVLSRLKGTSRETERILMWAIPTRVLIQEIPKLQQITNSKAWFSNPTQMRKHF